MVDAWKAIVGEESRREEAAKAEAERIATGGGIRQGGSGEANER